MAPLTQRVIVADAVLTNPIIKKDPRPLRFLDSGDGAG